MRRRRWRGRAARTHAGPAQAATVIAISRATLDAPGAVGTMSCLAFEIRGGLEAF
jgi:hypothetical protein